MNGNGSNGGGVATQNHKTMPPKPDAARMLADLHALQRRLTGPSIAEAIRLLESDKFARLTNGQIRNIAEYRPIAIEDEWFFKKAFSTGKEVAASLAYAKEVGREIVLEDLLQLRATASGPAEASARGHEGWNTLREAGPDCPA